MRWALALLLFSLLTSGTIYAQGLTLDESEFWARLEQTEVLVQVALVQSDPDSALESRDAAAELWVDVRQVRTTDSNINVDVTWITLPLSVGDSASLERLQRQIRALLDARRRSGSASSEGASFTALDEVLRDERFQYDDPLVPTPIPTQLPESDINAPNLSPEFSQTVLLVIGIILASVVVLYFARNLRVQSAALEASSADEPKTSAGAVDMAESHASARDYRSAMRYLYLSSLLLLNEKGLIHYDSTLTNREHLRQVRNQPQLYDLLRRVVNTFEEVWYGFAPVDETYYRQYVDTVEQLRRFVP